MKRIQKITLFFLIIFLMACAPEEYITPVDLSLTDTPLIPVTPSKTPFPTLPRQPTFTVAPTTTITLTPTLNPTQQIWVATNVAIAATQRVLDENERENIGKEIDKFPIACNDSYGFDISPDAKWLATNCGDKTYSILVVQNKEGTKWVLDFKDFLSLMFSNREEAPSGGLGTLFWDPQGVYLYFTYDIGSSGGGNFCYSYSDSTLGLFRLNLKTGSWVTLIPPPDYFSGDKIRFSPTGRRYAVDINGITITDLQTGNETQLNVSGVMDLIWSPDGTKLAYTTSHCNEEGFVIDSSLYIWDAFINESQLILRTEKNLLYPDSWDNISRLRIHGEEYVPEIENTVYTLYEYDATRDE